MGYVVNISRPECTSIYPLKVCMRYPGGATEEYSFTEESDWKDGWEFRSHNSTAPYHTPIDLSISDAEFSNLQSITLAPYLYVVKFCGIPLLKIGYQRLHREGFKCNRCGAPGRWILLINNSANIGCDNTSVDFSSIAFEARS